MTSTNFHILCQKISSNLITTRTTAEEQVAIFLLCVGHGDSMRKLGEYYQHSIESIYHFFKDVLKVILDLHDEYIKLPDSSAGIHHSVGPNNENYVFKVIKLKKLLNLFILKLSLLCFFMTISNL